MKLPTAVLFDFDGVLVDSVEFHQHAWSIAFSELFDKEICAFPIKTHAGKAPTEIAKFYAEYGGDISLAPEVLKRKLAAMQSSVGAPILLPGAREIMALLNKYKVPFGIASNASKYYVRRTVDFHQLNVPLCLGFEDYEILI